MSAGYKDNHYLGHPVPEFEDWLLEMGIFADINRLAPHGGASSLLNSSSRFSSARKPEVMARVEALIAGKLSAMPGLGQL